MKTEAVLESSASNCHPASVPDYLPLDELRKLQLQRLQAVVQRSWEHVELFRARYTPKNPSCRKTGW